MGKEISNQLDSSQLKPQSKQEVDFKQTAIEAITNFFDEKNIKKILYVDDKFDEKEQKEFFIGQMKSVRNSGDFPHDIPEFETINWSLPEIGFDKEMNEYWSNSENRKTGIHKICEYIGGDEGANVIPALEIKDFLGEHIDLLTPQEWMEKKEEEFKLLQPGESLLCLFDFELKGFIGENGEKDGLDLAKQLIESNDGSKAYCGIFSHKYSIEDEDISRLQYSTDYSLDLKTFYTISKKRFAYDPKLSAFAEGIKNVISLRYIEDLKAKSKSIIEESFKKSMEEFDNLTPKTFNQIVQKSSLTEGVWEANTLFRLQNIIQDYSNYEQLTDDAIRAPFEDSLSEIRKLDTIDTGYKYPDKDYNAIEIRNKEIYFNENIVGKLNFPISNGDIFKIGTKEFILLAQPCNLALRKEGKRNYGYNKAFLVPIENKTYNPTIHKKIASPSVEDNIYAVFPSFKVISLDILDLSVYNEEGKCFIDLNHDEINNNLVHFPWQKRYKIIHKEYSKQGKAYVAFEDIKAQMNGKLKGEIKILAPFFKKPDCIKDFKLGNHKIFDSKKQTFDFGIKRIKNYREPYSTDLLQSFMQYLSRNGFDVDFSKN